jgi:ABC-type transport system substrate-binding protein
VSESYWDKLLDKRLARRRALTAAGGAGVAAALLAACGGSEQDSKADKSSLLTSAVDTTKQSKRSGTIKDRTFSDVTTLDGLGANNPRGAVAFQVLSGLWQFKPGYLKPADNEVMADLAESWELSPDGLSVTCKLRQGVKWHNKPPVNNRALDMDDVLFSWQRFVAKNGARSSVANSINPDAPVISIAATDSKTAVIKFKEPIVYGVALFAGLGGGIPGVVYPKETDTNFDPRFDMIGTGPFVLTSYKPSVGFTFKRNADYYEKDDALAEQVDMPIVPEYAAALSHFKAGNIYSMGNYQNTPGVSSEDILTVKKEESRLLIYKSEFGRSNTRRSFGWLPSGKSPFLDERVRQAVSMSVDRALYVDTFFDASKFGSQGLPIEARWSTALSGSLEGWWLDPEGKDFGPNAKYFRHDPAEAKKLLAAAGFPNGLEVQSHYVTGPELANLPKQASVLDAMTAEIGITSKVRAIDYQKEYIPVYRDGRGQWEGWAYKTNQGAGPSGNDAVGTLAGEYWSKGGAAYFGFSLTGQNDQTGDPQIDSLIEKGRIERDTERRRQIVFDIQRRLGKAWYALPIPAVATGFVAAWPALGNFRVYQTERANYRLWVDDAKAPLAKT